MRFLNVAGRAFGAPLLLEPSRGLPMLEALGGYVRQRAFDGRSPLREYKAMDDDGPYERPEDRLVSLPFGLVRFGDKAFPSVGNVAVIVVDGSLVNRLGSLTPYCGMTGYDGLRTQIMAAMADSTIKAVALYVESPGGEVAGCFDLADMIHGMRGIKPIWAIVDGMACSAAYALSSACDRITCSSVGLLGSIGVIVAHCDFSAALEKAGMKVTLIYSGAHKADGNPYQALPEKVRAAVQAEIDLVYAQFVDRVAKFRNLGGDLVRETEADVFLAEIAAQRRLGDAVMSPGDALAELIESVRT